MALPKNISHYEDIRNLLDQALASERGLAIDVPSADASFGGRAIYFHQRINQFRLLHRQALLEIYPEGDPQRGKSPYDDLIVTRDGETVTMKKAESLKVVEL